MKKADVDVITEFLLGAGAQLFDLQFAELVRERLSGPDDIAIHFHNNVMLSLAAVGLEIIDGPLPGLAQRVHARVYYQPDGSPHLVGQLAEF